MISVTSNTRRTSMSGVVLMSHMGAELEPPTFMDILQNSSMHSELAAIGLGVEGHLDHSAALQLVENVSDRLVGSVLVAADIDLRLRDLHRLLLDHGQELTVVGDHLVVPEDLARRVHRDGDICRLG